MRASVRVPASHISPVTTAPGGPRPSAVEAGAVQVEPRDTEALRDRARTPLGGREQLVGALGIAEPTVA